MFRSLVNRNTRQFVGRSRLLIVGFGLLVLTQGPAVSASREAVPPGIYGSKADDVIRVAAEKDRFEVAGLVLPPLRIFLHAALVDCGGAPGVFNVDRSGDRIDLCTDDAFVIRHELAHAWEYHTLTNEARDRFKAVIGLHVWNDGSVLRRDRAIEVAANVIAWGLGDGCVASDQELEFAELFRLLTDQPSPRLCRMR